jgi:hypothetical protein
MFQPNWQSSSVQTGFTLWVFRTTATATGSFFSWYRAAMHVFTSCFPYLRLPTLTGGSSRRAQIHEASSSLYSVASLGLILYIKWYLNRACLTCVEHAAAESPVELSFPNQNSLPGRALPSHAYETTSSFPASSGSDSFECGGLLEKRIWIPGPVTEQLKAMYGRLQPHSQTQKVHQ